MKAFQRRQRRDRTLVAGLSSSSVRVLGAIARRGDGCQPGQIVEELAMTTSNVAASLRELEAAGVIRREKDGADARRVNVRLTADGETLVAENRAARDTWLGEAMDALLTADEQATLIAAGDLLERLTLFDPTSAARNE